MTDNLIISGISSSGGGQFQLVKIDGIARVSQDLVCDEMIVNGRLTASGLSGRLVVINGDASFGGAVRAEQLKAYGRLRAEGRVNAEEIYAAGSLRITGDCESERFTMDGGFKIDGLLNAGTVDICLQHNCKAKEIGGDSIQVRMGERRLLKLFPPKLTVETIEGDEIRLEFTKAEVVRGNKVWIGPGCDIRSVEYKSTLERAPAAKIGRAVKL